MRYLNWDVLLFPEGTKAPLQEFKASCYATEDLDSPQVQTITPQGKPSDHTVPRLMPTVACFIPNLPHGNPFRISLHSWEPPRATRSTKALAHHGTMICFEARVLLDGTCVAGILFGQQTAWPQVIDTVSHFDKAGNPDILTFPPFHPEMLTQNLWNPGETMGRIKVIIAEGLVQSDVTSPFERKKNLVSFSFQHAPLETLEDAAIAWPNPSMWYQFPQQPYSICSPRKLEAIDEDAHSHSPHGGGTPQDNGIPTTSARAGSHGLMVHPPPQTGGRKLEDCLWPEAPAMMDPFVEGDQSQIVRTRAGRKSSSDQSMPDYVPMPDYPPIPEYPLDIYPGSISPTSGRSISHNHDLMFSTTHVACELPRSQFDELLADCSPHEDTSSGTYAPANTRESSAANTPQTQARLSAAAEARAASYSFGQPRSVPVTTRDPPPTATGVSSDVSINFVDPPEAVDQHSMTVTKNPSKAVRSRKEGKNGSGRGQKEPAAEPGNDSERESGRESIEELLAISASKRKRLGLEFSPFKRGESDFSPSRKVSRLECQDGLSGSVFDDMRNPLTSLGPLDGVN